MCMRYCVTHVQYSISDPYLVRIHMFICVSLGKVFGTPDRKVRFVLSITNNKISESTQKCAAVYWMWNSSFSVVYDFRCIPWKDQPISLSALIMCKKFNFSDLLVLWMMIWCEWSLSVRDWILLNLKACNFSIICISMYAPIKVSAFVP